MEARVSHIESSPAVPAYEEWPSVPAVPLQSMVNDERTLAMDVDELHVNNDRKTRQTSELSMDDIEAAQALEGLRAGEDTRYIS